MSEKRFTIVFVLALVMGAAATFGVYKFINAQRLAAAQLGRVETAPVVVADDEIGQGMAIGKGDLTIRHYPTSAIPDGGFSNVDDVAGRVTRVPLYKGEPVLDSKLAALGAQPGIEVKISPGHRAMAVRVSDIVGITGLVRPESRVDILVTMRATKNGRDQPIGKIILQDMRVLSVGTQTDRGDPSKPIVSSAVTLEVTPKEAEILAVAMNEGSLSLALRSYGDPNTTETDGATSDQVLAGIPILKPTPRRVIRRPPSQPTPEVEVPDSTRTVQIYRGGKLEEQKVTRDSTQNGGNR